MIIFNFKIQSKSEVDCKGFQYKMCMVQSEWESSKTFKFTHHFFISKRMQDCFWVKADNSDSILAFVNASFYTLCQLAAVLHKLP